MLNNAKHLIFNLFLPSNDVFLYIFADIEICFSLILLFLI